MLGHLHSEPRAERTRDIQLPGGEPESRPAVLEVLCDECESALNFEEFEDTLRKEVLLTIGAR